MSYLILVVDAQEKSEVKGDYMILGNYVIKALSIPRFDRSNQTRFCDMTLSKVGHNETDVEIQCIEFDPSYKLGGEYVLSLTNATVPSSSRYLCTSSEFVSVSTHSPESPSTIPLQPNAIDLYFNNLDDTDVYYTEVHIPALDKDSTINEIVVGNYYNLTISSVN